MKATEDLTIEEWKSLFENEDVFKYENMLIMRRFLDIGGAATCSQLSRRYGDEWTYYNLMCSSPSYTILEFSPLFLSMAYHQLLS